MILVTGGCGYLGSYCVLRLLENNEKVIAIDNFSNSSKSVIEVIKSISNKNMTIVNGDVRDRNLLRKTFYENKIDTVIHFAGLKSQIQSYQQADEYFSVNVNGTICLLEVMKENSVNNLIFSSSATVYGKEHPVPWNENIKLNFPDSPYAQSKLIVERLIEEEFNSNNKLQAGILRYFNPLGYHESGLLGENIEYSTNLIPEILRCLLKKKEYVSIFGDNYDTPDGTGVRDYVHISDLIDGHINAMKFIKKNKGCHVWNLGSGKGYSVKEILNVFELKASRKIKFHVEPKRKGDVGSYWADISKAKKELNWFPKKDINKMIEDVLIYYKKNI